MSLSDRGIARTKYQGTPSGGNGDVSSSSTAAAASTPSSSLRWAQRRLQEGILFRSPASLGSLKRRKATAPATSTGANSHSSHYHTTSTTGSATTYTNTTTTITDAETPARTAIAGTSDHPSSSSASPWLVSNIDEALLSLYSMVPERHHDTTGPSLSSSDAEPWGEATVLLAVTPPAKNAPTTVTTTIGTANHGGSRANEKDVANNNNHHCDAAVHEASTTTTTTAGRGPCQSARIITSTPSSTYNNTATPSSSFIPRVEYDWLLDPPPLEIRVQQEEDCRQSQILMDELELGADRSFHQLDRWILQWEQQYMLGATTTTGNTTIDDTTGMPTLLANAAEATNHTTITHTPVFGILNHDTAMAMTVTTTTTNAITNLSTSESLEWARLEFETVSREDSDKESVGDASKKKEKTIVEEEGGGARIDKGRDEEEGDDDDTDDDFGDFQSAPSHLDQCNLNIERNTFNVGSVDDAPNPLSSQNGSDMKELQDTHSLSSTIQPDEIVDSSCSSEIATSTPCATITEVESQPTMEVVPPPFEVIDLPTLTSIDNNYHQSSNNLTAVFERSFRPALVPLSLSLPWNDLSTPEARFVRRRQDRYRKEQAHVLGLEPQTNIDESFSSSSMQPSLASLQDTLPAYYFTSKKDDTVRLLKTLPWPDSDDQTEEWDSYMTEELCRLDASLDVINRQVLEDIQPHVEHVQLANSLYQDLEQNVQRGLWYHQRAMQSIRDAWGRNGRGLSGQLDILRSAFNRDIFRQLHSVLDQIHNVDRQMNDIEHRIKCLDGSWENYEAILELWKQLQYALEETDLARLTGLNTYRSRLDRIPRQVWQRLDRLCQNCIVSHAWNPPVWDKYADVYRIAQHWNTKHSLRDSFVGQWVQSIRMALEYEIELSLVKALLETPSDDYANELDQLATEIEMDWGDLAKLRVLTHNLVTIRFDFEFAKFHLPGVIRRACYSMRRLHEAHMDFVQWHSTEEVLQKTLCETRASIAEYCEHVLIRCLEKYRNVRLDLFVNGSDTAWVRELQSLHHVALDCLSFSDGSRSSLLQNAVADTCRRHVRSVHVEAMNSMGRQLANESWLLNDFPIEGSGPNLLLLCLEHVYQQNSRRWNENCLSDRYIFTDDESSITDFSTAVSPNLSVVHDHLRNVISGTDSPSRLAPRCVTKDLLEWFSRLIAVAKYLPMVVQDVSDVVKNLCDLYVTTILRLCAGSALNERYVLGISEPTAFFAENEEPLLSPSVRNVVINGNQSNMMQHLRSKRSISRPALSLRISAIPNTLDAEICYPFQQNRDAILQLRNFILRAQKSLQGVVSLDMVDSWLLSSRRMEMLEEEALETVRTLEKRIAAASSLFAIAGLLESSSILIREHMNISKFGTRFVNDLTSWQDYASAWVEIVPSMVAVTKMISSQRAIGSARVVKEIVNNSHGWEECTINEDPSDYVDSLCEKCALIWGFLAASGKLPDSIRRSTWKSIMESSYLTLLEGFARIPFCSTEGRALMAIDLASFSSGLRPAAITKRLERVPLVVSPPPVLELERGMSYVDTYIKVYYFPSEERLSWIRQNYQRYHLNHILALAATNTDSPEDKPAVSFGTLKSEVRKLYAKSVS